MRDASPGRSGDGQVWVSLRCSRSGARSATRPRAQIRGDEARALYEYVIYRHRFLKIPSVRVGSAGDTDQPGSLERLVDTLEAILIRRGSSRSTALRREFAKRAGHVEEIVRTVLDESAQAIHGYSRSRKAG